MCSLAKCCSSCPQTLPIADHSSSSALGHRAAQGAPVALPGTQGSSPGPGGRAVMQTAGSPGSSSHKLRVPQA